MPELEGSWRFEFSIEGEALPFNAEISTEEGNLCFYVVNAEERIRAERFKVEGDSVSIQLPIFNTELKGVLHGDSIIVGTYFDYSRKGNYSIPFSAKKHVKARFYGAQAPLFDPTGRWEVRFSPDSESEYQAIGEFIMEGQNVHGTFLTTTGDYRFLEGNMYGDSLFLSCFDGSHVFLFKAQIEGESIRGDFWSGDHWQENWQGIRNEKAMLPDANSLTYLKDGFDQIEFSFNNIEGETVSLIDDKFKNKVVIVQIMGSWCPNCMDETAYLVSLYNNLSSQGLEIVSLAFEKSDNEETNLHSLKRLRDHFKVPYEILLAGKASKREAANKLPMLNHVLSFPTSIYIDRTGKVRRIHTGFSGPGTGEYYKEFVEETNRFVTQLLIE